VTEFLLTLALLALGGALYGWLGEYLKRRDAEERAAKAIDMLFTPSPWKAKAMRTETGRVWN